MNETQLIFLVSGQALVAILCLYNLIQDIKIMERFGKMEKMLMPIHPSYQKIISEAATESILKGKSIVKMSFSEGQLKMEHIKE